MAEIDLMTDRAHSARIDDPILGGKTNYAADRVVADTSMRLFPALATSAHADPGVEADVDPKVIGVYGGVAREP